MKKHSALRAIGLLLVSVIMLFVFPLGVPFVLMALAKDRTRVSVQGGGIFKLRELTSGGAETTMLFLGYLEETGFVIEGEIVEFRDERGYLVQQLRSTEDWKFNIITSDVGIDVINLLKNAQNKFYHVYYQGPQMPNGNYQEIYVPLGKFNPNLALKFATGKRTIPVEFKALMPKGAVDVTPNAFDVPADTYGIITENAAVQGEVTTATGTIYTAAV